MHHEVSQRGTSWRRSLRSGVVLGLVLAFHGGLALFLLAGRSALRTCPTAAAAIRRDALQIAFLPRPMRAPVVRSIAPPAAASPARQRPRALTVVDMTPAPPSPIPQASRTLDLRAPARHDAGDFGNHAWRRGLTDASSDHATRLPGEAAGKWVHPFRLTPRKALKERVETIGKFMNCSIAIIKRHAQSDTPQRINQAHAAYGCTK